MQFEGVTTQMKALNEYFLMVAFALLLDRIHVFANFIFNLDRETIIFSKVSIDQSSPEALATGDFLVYSTLQHQLHVAITLYYSDG